MFKAYLKNLMSEPTNEKFKKIRKENKAFKERVADVKGGVVFLKALGFVDAGEFLEITKVDQELLKAASALLQ